MVRRDLKPPPKLSVSGWADAKRQLSPEASAEPGRWVTSRAEYQRGIMDAVSDSRYEEVVLMTSAQVGKTEVINNAIGCYVEHDPSPMLIIQPTLEMGGAWSKDRLAPMVRDTSALSSLFASARTRDSGNTILHKVFPGGHLTIAGANSPASLASRPVRFVFCDEVDRYPPSAGQEGDPINLARRRTATFWNRKIVMCSTPTIKGASRIEAAYADSSRDNFWVPCPHCGVMQFLRWPQVRWTTSVDALYFCTDCEAGWTDAERWNAVRHGEWRSENPDSPVRGFHLNELYSPWTSLEKMVREFLSAKKSPETLKTWINTALGEVWEEKGARDIKPHILEQRAEHWTELPEAALCITAGVDVQEDRLEVELVAWSQHRESWSVAYEVIPGNPRLRPGLPDSPWDKLDALRKVRWPHASGHTLACAAMFVDAGYIPDEVYKFTLPRESQRVWACKGMGGAANSVIRTESRNNDADALICSLAVDLLKSQFYSWLEIEEPGPHYCHFPDHRQPAYFEGLVSEVPLIRWKKGHQVIEWVVKTGVRNEPLDARGYAIAALVKLNPRWPALWRRLQRGVARPDELEANAEAATSKPTAKPKRRRRAGGYAGRLM